VRPRDDRRPLSSYLWYFLGLGTWGFGGPIATVGYMQRDLVERRQWLTERDLMIDEDTYCVGVLTQLQAGSAASDAVGLKLLDDHVRTCVTEAVQSGDGAEKLDELTAAVRRFARR
jgi:DNA-binding FrmR family transcriptional regulator